MLEQDPHAVTYVMTGSRDTMELHGDNLSAWEVLKTSIFRGPSSYLLFQGGQATPDDVRDAIAKGWLHVSSRPTTYARGETGWRRRRSAPSSTASPRTRPAITFSGGGAAPVATRPAWFAATRRAPSSSPPRRLRMAGRWCHTRAR
ncbi:hypothetical protein EMIHUDRAFT_446688 [Emiliania huxleyi CCMP1516]|uniref:Uncharacterized protein n=2 Tax=Emiliania huxleyi TaxID=2903 RepID=A0A0D3HYB6_EMIH1|nr:hypothetical protein EMIHUDRAFT_446688 [Emiliania huxleyi CCMP1516]EOD04001.1 hypothetical protein EMIHUDRAFT_446688 [Emiliania huxleyi CCMP1516]|eukprot:XP_005756430.1 hypothetical protein EMIHUDRAFT_446688 [Emiliania huxleyi CCMP1516]